MKRKKAILEALVFSSIMTLAIPGMAGAATTNIGSVTVDGVNTLPSTKRNTSTVGKAGSAVSIGKMAGEDPYSFFLEGAQQVDVLGKKVDSSAMMAKLGSNLQAGDGNTDTVTITGNPVSSDSKSTWGQYGIMALGRGAKVKVQAKNIAAQSLKIRILEPSGHRTVLAIKKLLKMRLPFL